MADPIRLLEDRVARAIERLGRLSRERDGLMGEVEALRERIAALERQGRTGATEGQHESWQRSRAEIAVALRETLLELRSE